MTGQRAKKKSFRKIARNPLKRLDSDERIQGNPSFSNPSPAAFRAAKRGHPRKSKSGARPPPTLGALHNYKQKFTSKCCKWAERRSGPMTLGISRSRAG